MNATSFLLNKQNYQFLEGYTKKHSVNKSKVINYALDLFRKYNLKKELRAGFQSQTDDDVFEAMSDFADYVKIVDQN